MTIVAVQSSLVNQSSIVRLARYCSIVGVRECNFLGVNDGQPSGGYDCQDIWTKGQRDEITKYLAEAQDEIEQEIGFPLAPRYIGQGQSDIWQDWQPIKHRLVTRFARLIEVGIEATSDISLAETVDHTNDPAEVGPIATTVTDVNEVHVYHPGTDVEIDPSSITIAGGNMTIYIPRCRMLTEAANDNDENGADYTDLANFEDEVDVKRIYTDTSVQATIAHLSDCSSCEETTLEGCLHIRDRRVGIVDLRRRCTSSFCSGCGGMVKLNYKAGMDVLTSQAEDAIVRLAHSKMPNQPCGCEPANLLWQRDRNVPEVLSVERLNCKFGLANGSWAAFKYAQAMKVYRVSVL
jgi:hypothetical protein